MFVISVSGPQGSGKTTLALTLGQRLGAPTLSRDPLMGAIKDSGRGKIIGTRSYGKGSVQGIFPLGKSGAGARLTTAKFFSPSGRAIANVGVTPDIDVPRATTVAAVGAGGAGGQTPTLVNFRGANNIGAPMATNSAAKSSPTMARAPLPMYPKTIWISAALRRWRAAWRWEIWTTTAERIWWSRASPHRHECIGTSPRAAIG